VPEPAQAATTVTIYQANLQHGQYTDGSFNYAGQADLLAAGVDIVTANEVSVGDLTNWDNAFAANGMSRALYFANSTIGDGNAIWFRNSTVTLLETYSHKLSNGFISWDDSTDVDKSAVAVKVSVSGKVFYVVSTHLCWSRCADASGSLYSTQRVSQINELLSWVNTTLTGADVVIAGDMNFGPDYPRMPDPALQIDLFTVNYDDMWQAGLANGKAFAPWGDREGNGVEDMPLGSLTTRTADSRRIDYFFLRKNASDLSLSSITLPDLRATCPQALVAGVCPNVTQRWGFAEDAGVRPSDHNWLKAVFDISSPLPPTDTTAPTVSLAAPLNGATVSGTIAIDASANDEVGVVGVQFKLDGNNLGTEDVIVPYSVNWDTMTVADGEHNISAVARDAAGNISTSSITVTVSNTPPPPPVPAPAINSFTTTPTTITTGQSVTLSWSTSNAESVSIDQGVGVVVSTGSMTVTPSATTTYTLTATNSTGSVAAQVTITVNVPPPPPPIPAAPTNLTGTAISSTQLRLNWSDNASNESGYKIERCKGSGCTTFAQITTTDANVKTFTDNGLNKNNAYRYRVRAYNNSGNSAYTNIVEAKTLK